jgi:hypothetical protein
LLLQANVPIVAVIVVEGRIMFSSNLVQMGGLAAITAGVLLLILDA